MKKKLKIIGAAALMLAAITFTSRASIVWAGTPLTVPAGTQVTSGPVQIGTLSFPSPNLFVQSYTGSGATNIFVKPALTFDNTNLFNIGQQYQFPGYPTNAGPVTLTNTSYPVYGVLIITNGLGTNITVNITSP
jgi:hypothetical protein